MFKSEGQEYFFSKYLIYFQKLMGLQQRGVAFTRYTSDDCFVSSDWICFMAYILAYFAFSISFLAFKTARMLLTKKQPIPTKARVLMIGLYQIPRIILNYSGKTGPQYSRINITNLMIKPFQPEDFYLSNLSLRQRHSHIKDIKMSLLLNKKITEERSLAQKKIVASRKLKIKVSELLNFRERNSKQKNQTNREHHLSTSFLGLKETSSIARKLKVKPAVRQESTLKTKCFSLGNKTIKTEQKEENFKIFSHLKDQQLDEIEGNPQYYLVKTEFILKFRQFMQIKRYNTKQKSYDKFLTHIPSKNLQFTNPNEPNFIEPQAFYKTRIRQKTEKPEIMQLLTNPLQTHQSQNLFKVKHHNFRNSGQKIQNVAINRNKIFSEKLLKVREDRIHYVEKLNYASSLRAKIDSQKQARVIMRNKRHQQKLLKAREYLKEQRLYGRFVQASEKMRSSFIRSKPYQSERQKIKNTEFN